MAALSLLVGGLACRRPRISEAVWQPDGGWTDEPVEEPQRVYFKELQGFLPAFVPGFKKVRDEGSTGKYGEVAVSEAERVFAQSDANREIAIRILDSSMGAGLAEAIKAAALEASQKGQPDLAAPLSLPEAVGYVRYDASERKGEANLLVGNRFVVSVVGRGSKDSADVRRIAENLDSVQLSKLR